MAATILGFATNVVGLQKPICKVPGVRAVCASWGLGGLPTKDEEALWAKRVPGDCSGLRDYLTRFPKGALTEEADRKLQAAETRWEESWTQGEDRRLPLTVRATLDPLVNEKAAHGDALMRSAREAEQACEGFKGDEYRLVSSKAEPQSWRCFPRGSGSVCGFDGQAICQVQMRKVTQRQVCR